MLRAVPIMAVDQFSDHAIVVRHVITLTHFHV